MSYIFFKKRGTEGKRDGNSNKYNELCVPHRMWDSDGTEKALGHVGQAGQ